jgi:phosphoglucomutase
VKPAYFDVLREIIDLSAIKRAGLRGAFDPLWGARLATTPTGCCEKPASRWRPCTITATCFSGGMPLNSTISCSTNCGQRCGKRARGDADRFGIVDQDGRFLQPNYIIALLFDYLVESRGWRNGVGKSVATTNLISALAEHHRVELHETPVGFKYIGELIKQDKIAIGGEESAGSPFATTCRKKMAFWPGCLLGNGRPPG